MARVFLQLAHSKLERRWDLQKCCFYSIKLRFDKQMDIGTFAL